MRPAVVALALIAGFLAASAAGSSYHLTITGEDGQALWSLPVRPGASAVLAYTNSIYGAPVEEHLVITRGGFTLTKVRSPSQAVLAYNGLEAPYAREDGAYAVRVTAHWPALVLRIGQTGRQRLIVAGAEVPLYAAGEGARLHLQVTRR